MTDEQRIVDPRVRDVRDLLAEFKPERIVYLAVAVAMIALQICIFLLFWNRGQAGWTEFVIMMGPGGMVVLAAGRVLRMWTDALQYVGGRSDGSGKERAK
jgi:hypothetical protein